MECCFQLRRLSCVCGLLLVRAGCGMVSVGITDSPAPPDSCGGDGRPSNGVCPH